MVPAHYGLTTKMAFVIPSLSLSRSNSVKQSHKRHTRTSPPKRFRTSSAQPQTLQNLTAPLSPLISTPIPFLPFPDTTPSPSSPKPLKPTTLPQRPKRRPHGFWNDLANVQHELELVNAQLGRPRQRVIPRLSEISALKRGDLVAALGKHGGVKRVAAALRWKYAGSHRRKRREALSADALVTTQARRSLVPRRPNAYWRDRARVETEIGAFVAEFGTVGVLPTRTQFYAFGRADLVQAAANHGGLGDIGRGMGLKCRGRPRKRGYWKDFEPLKIAIEKFANQYCPGRMPTADELSAKGHSAVANAIAAHGGFPLVAEKCGLKKRAKGNQGAPNVWNVEKLKKDLFGFMEENLPKLADDRIMPSERQLRKHGRNDLSYAIKKFGGFATVGTILGLKKKPKGPFRKEC